MEQVQLNYSTYLKRLIEKEESVMKCMRWKAFFFDSDPEDFESKPDDKFASNPENVRRKMQTWRNLNKG